jgi:hypothetical protein
MLHSGGHLPGRNSSWMSRRIRCRALTDPNHWIAVPHRDGPRGGMPIRLPPDVVLNYHQMTRSWVFNRARDNTNMEVTREAMDDRNGVDYVNQLLEQWCGVPHEWVRDLSIVRAHILTGILTNGTRGALGGLAHATQFSVNHAQFYYPVWSHYTFGYAGDERSPEFLDLMLLRVIGDFPLPNDEDPEPGQPMLRRVFSALQEIIGGMDALAHPDMEQLNADLTYYLPPEMTIVGRYEGTHTGRMSSSSPSYQEIPRRGVGESVQTAVDAFRRLGSAFNQVGASIGAAGIGFGSRTIRMPKAEPPPPPPPPHPDAGKVIKPPRLKRSYLGEDYDDIRQADGSVLRQIRKDGT